MLAAGRESTEVSVEVVPDGRGDCVRVIAMHRVDGLEFQAAMISQAKLISRTR